MKITLDIPDGMLVAFLSGVVMQQDGLEMVNYPLGVVDLQDGNTIKLPRDGGEEEC